MAGEPKQRTNLQNNAMHLYFEQVAEELSRGGHTMQQVCKVITKVEITPTKENVKEIIWKEIQKALFGKTSTTELEKHEVDRVYEVMARFLAREFEISIPFPNDPDPAPLLEK